MAKRAGLTATSGEHTTPFLHNSACKRTSNAAAKPRSIRKGGFAVNNFEEITKNPETLGAFLRGLPVIEAPWDEAFQRKYCAGCGKVSCDDGSPCPYEDKRNNPLWWLSQESEGTQRA